ATLYAIRESKLKAGLIWTGANDGPINVTQDNGKTWTNVTPKDLPPGGRVQNIDPSPHRPGAAYVAVLRYLLGDFQPYIYKTENYGKSWTRLTTGSNGIPADYPTRVVREDPTRPGLLYAGTEFGMFVSFDDGAHWHPMQLNLPTTPVTDIVVHRNDLVISTQGRSFWILDDITPLQQMTDGVASTPAHLFAPREAIRYRYRAGFGGAEAERTPTDDAPQYPPAGAMIDYWLSSPTGPVTLDILDARGAVIRTFAADTARSRSGGRGAASDLPARAGLNRFVWDMTFPGPTGASGGFGGRAGAMAAPGQFTVRLTAGGTTSTQSLVLRADPRVTRDGITQAMLEQQLAFNLKVRDLVSDANKMAEQLRTAKRPDLDATFFTPPVRYSKPGLQAHITYLYSQQLGADQRVGRDAVQRYAELRKALDDLTTSLRSGGR
ncbi:MAG: hypothetical protein JWM95_440, partial [Gemmatimonadetes bacterium]|nr:hypothetical protein [Gemmatimonadota bacterium]